MLAIIVGVHRWYDERPEPKRFILLMLFLLVGGALMGGGISLQSIPLILAGLVFWATLLGTRIWYVEYRPRRSH